MRASSNWQALSRCLIKQTLFSKLLKPVSCPLKRLRPEIQSKTKLARPQASWKMWLIRWSRPQQPMALSSLWLMRRGRILRIMRWETRIPKSAASKKSMKRKTMKTQLKLRIRRWEILKLSQMLLLVTWHLKKSSGKAKTRHWLLISKLMRPKSRSILKMVSPLHQSKIFLTKKRKYLERISYFQIREN